ncbi:MAG: hypothetical protein O3C34_07910 [Proteobacteria bacterium]|nr:hypothetical protein [Pseudomonadota bacterium]
MIPKEDYIEWAPVRLVDPRAAKVEQIIHGMDQIIAVEGPVMASRVFHIFSRAGGLSRIYDETRRAFLRALRTALDEGIFVAEQEALEDPATWILRLPSQARVRTRTLGTRTLHEIPAAELAEYMLEIRIENELISREELFRKVLNEYGLTRLTEATTNRLEYVLKTWF